MLRIDVLVLALAVSASIRPLVGPGGLESPSAVASDAGSSTPAADLPPGLAAADWSSIQRVHEAKRHAAIAVEGGYRTRTPGQAWETTFDGRGFTVLPDGGGWEWGLELVRYGLAGNERAACQPLAVSASGQRVSYDWDGILEEWYVNDASGLEHGYTLHERPGGDASAPGPLVLELAVRGALCPEVVGQGRDVRFVAAAGESVLVYAGLTVLDADGRELAAGFAPSCEGLLLTIDQRDARYPLTIDPIAQRAYLKASNTEANDQFGVSIAMSGSTVVVGAIGEDSAAIGVNGPQNDNSAATAGAAYVFVRDATGWSQQAYLKPLNTGSNDFFGGAVAISGDTVVVGAHFEYGNATGVNGDHSNNAAPLAGAAYVFVRNGTTWSQQAYLKASNTELVEFFGYSVAVSGDTVVVGAYAEDSAATGVNGDQNDNSAFHAGAAYVFVRDGTSWSQQAYLKASNTESRDRFGWSVALSGDTAMVGAAFESSAATGVNGDQSNNDAPESGAVYVFRRSGTTWSQEAYLKASNAAGYDHFGGSLSVSENTLLVAASGEDGGATGVNGEDNDNAGESGAVYVFFHDGSGWSQQAYLKASNTEFGDSFGYSICVSGDTAVVGAFAEDSGATGVGGDETNNNTASSGAAYVFGRNGMDWSQQAYLKASNTGEADYFGTAVALSGETIVVGADAEDSSAKGINGNQNSNASPGAGAVYVFSPPRAAVTFRNGGSNPASYVANAIVIGTTFTATVDNNLPAQLASLLLAFESSTSFSLAGGQWLLCIDASGAGELFTGSGLVPVSSSAGVDGYALGVPNVPALAGYSFCSQAIQFGSPPFALSNAQDFTIGGF